MSELSSVVDEPPDHHRVGDSHRHLREVGRSERRREREQLSPHLARPCRGTK